MAGIAAYGTQFLKGAVPVTNISSISGGGLSLDLEDTTAHDSTDAFEESVATILRSSEIRLDLNYDPSDATHKELIADMIAKLPIMDYTVKLPAGEVWTYTGGAYVTGFDQASPHAGKLTSTATIKPTGVVTPPA